MRVIAGKYKGRTLFSPKDQAVRPTTDRIKENVFNLLQTRIPGCDFLDLFGGSGAMSIEALSRGAAGAVLVDCDKESVKLIKKNLSALGIGREAELLETDYARAAERLRGRSFDVIFLDPPYRADFYEDVLDKIASFSLLKEGGVAVFEHATDRALSLPEGWRAADERKYGSVTISLLVFDFRSSIDKERQKV